MSLELLFLENQYINKDKWDNCIARSKKPLIYGFSWFLDTVAPDWSAIILGDYDAVFPLNLKKKFGIGYVMQPFLSQQSGIFSASALSKDEINRVYKAIPALILTMHTFADCYEVPEKYRASKRNNFVLNLKPLYSELQKRYSSNCIRNLKKAVKEQQSSSQKIKAEEFLPFLLENMNYPATKLYQVLIEKIVKQATNSGKGFFEGVFNNSGTMLAVGFFLQSPHELVFLAGASSPEGFKKKSMFYLMDNIIQKYAGSDLQLDFEGSANENVARFYKGFGSENQPYFVYEHYLLRFFSKFM